MQFDEFYSTITEKKKEKFTVMSILHISHFVQAMNSLYFKFVSTIVNHIRFLSKYMLYELNASISTQDEMPASLFLTSAVSMFLACP
jgi:hypothetical protein